MATMRRRTRESALARASSGSRRADPARVFEGGGEMGALMRSIDWAKTPIGPVEHWSQALRSTLALLLHNRSELLLWWGPEFVQLYNDAYRPVLGEKHPRAMGQRASDCWTEIWDIIRPMIERPFRGEPASTADDLLLGLRRKNFLEEAHFRVAYSPVPDETVEPTGIGGVLATITETTQQVFAERQLHTLRDLGERSGAASRSAEDACAAAAETLAGNPWDVPFALFYLLDDNGTRARRVTSVGFDAALLERAAPAEVELSGEGSACWSLGAVASEKKPIVLDELTPYAATLPESPWGEIPHSALVLPLAAPEQANIWGVLVCGVSPHRVLDAGYRTFFELAAGQVVIALRNARALEEERKRAEGLAEIDRAKTAFFSNVSHEFRTPLTLMRGPTEDLLSGALGPLTAAQMEHLRLIHRSELRLQKLVDSLLDFARIEAGRLEANYEPLDLAALTRDLASSFRAAIERAGLTLEVDCAPLDEPVYADRGMWEKIVLNLLSNAFKFTFDGSIRVSLHSEAGKVVLRVADSGVGVPAHELPRLFERFHRVEGTRSRTHEGSGIGLAFVQELARLHGGTVHAESQLGAGSTFSVILPKGSSHLPKEHIGAPRSPSSKALGAEGFVEEALRWLPSDPEPDAQFVTEEFGRASPSQRSLRILLADDNADLRDYLRRILERHWTVKAVEDGAKALAAARDWAPDLILTDVMMPGLDGVALLAELRRDAATKSIPVILLSARAGEESRVEGLASGADDYLVKPFSARELIARIRVHLENARLRQERERQLQEAERTAWFSEMFVGILGHDLRNPLSAISMAATLLESRADTERIRTPVGRILASAERMDRMIAQLLDYTSIRLGRGLPLARTRVDLATECRATIEELEPVLKRDMHLEVQRDTVGEWDRDRLSQLLSNLIANACQHGAPGTPIRIRLDGSSPSTVEGEVHNEGAIPDDVLRVLFEPLHARRTREKREGSSGLGLGLYISRQIVLAHGGKIHVESTPDGGTRFVFTLPRDVPENSQGVGSSFFPVDGREG